MSEEKNINRSIKENIKILNKLKEENSDLIIREIEIGKSTRGLIAYIEDLCDKNIINRDILMPILNFTINEGNKNVVEDLYKSIMATGEIEKIYTEDKIVQGLLNGAMILLVNGSDIGFSMDVNGGIERNIAPPQMGTNIYSPLDSFVEKFKENITLIRRKLRDSDLKVIYINIDQDEIKKLSVVYKDKVADEQVIDAIVEKLNNINTNKQIDLEYISKHIENRKATLFPMGQFIERPSIVVEKLKKGSIGIICDQCPRVIMYPTKFTDFFKTSDDYYYSFVYRYSIWFLRLFCFFISIISPAMYIGIVSFNQEILPSGLSLVIAKSISEVPFPTIIEVFVVIFLVTIIKEASSNLPEKLGSSMVSVVGGIILGQSLIATKLVSSSIVILVTFSIIAQLIIPDYKIITTISILSVSIAILASFLGLFGVALGLFAVVIRVFTLYNVEHQYNTITQRDDKK